MIATAVPHSAFDKPDCPGYLDIVGRPRFVVEFVCSECGETVACARDEDMAAALQILNFAAGLTSIHCPRCGFANNVAGLDSTFAVACQRCGRNIDLAVPPRN